MKKLSKTFKKLLEYLEKTFNESQKHLKKLKNLGKTPSKLKIC
jgi:hypothetical protein